MNLQLQAIKVTGCATLHHNCTILTFLLLCRKCHASSQSHLECSTSIGPHHPHYRGGAGGGVRTMTTLILHCLAYLKRTLLLSCFSYDISCSSSLWQQRSYAYIYVLRMGEVLHTLTSAPHPFFLGTLAVSSTHETHTPRPKHSTHKHTSGQKSTSTGGRDACEAFTSKM